MSKKSSKINEFNHFSSIAAEWWLPKGHFKILHEITPLRISYILSKIDKKNVSKLKILDLGCGGGLTCEPLARLKADVTGIDFIEENIKIAKNHAKKSKLNINYVVDDIDNLKDKKKYDIVLLLEIIEHLDDWKKLIKKIKKNIKPNGLIIISTINRNIFSKFFALFLAENILNWIPKKTHNYNKLIKPKELSNFLKKNDFEIKDITGMNYNPLLGQWKISKNNHLINYFCTAKLV